MNSTFFLMVYWVSYINTQQQHVIQSMQCSTDAMLLHYNHDDYHRLILSIVFDSIFIYLFFFISMNDDGGHGGDGINVNGDGFADDVLPFLRLLCGCTFK